MTVQVNIVGVQFSNFVRAVQFCCEEIGVSYALGTELNNQQYELRSAALKTLHPFGKVPVLFYEGKTLFETQSICRFLDNHFNLSRLQPDDPWLRAQVDQWCAAISIYADKAIVRNYLLEFLFPKGENGSVRKDAVAAAIPDVLTTVAILEKQLGNRQFLVGDEFTLADIMVTPMLHYLSGAPNNAELINSDSPLRDYIKRNVARPAAKHVFI